MSQLQGVGHDQTAAQLCRGVSVFDPRWIWAGPIGWLGWALLHFGIGFAGTWLARGYALRHQLIDHPGARRSHDVATPRGGGIAIVASLLLASGCAIAITPAHAAFLGAFITGLILVAGVGWADDHRPLSPWWRLVVQGVAATLLAWGTWHQSGNLPAAAVAFVAAMVLINVWNFMDGIDALAASQALLVALGYGVAAGGGATLVLAVALVAACAGFLPFNLPKARIFLGDVGSGALGYALAALAILVAGRNGRLAPLLLLPTAAFLIDASLTLLERMAQGQRWWLPHTQHIYQRWAQRMRRHGMVTLAYGIWTAISVAVMILLVRSQAGVAYIIGIVLVVFLIGAVAWIGLRGVSERDVRGRE